MKFLPITFFIQLVLLPIFVVGDCTCDSNDETLDKSTALKYKIAAIVSILIGGAIGVCLPMLGKAIPALQPERDVFFIIKTFAAGVILATGFIHVLPDAFESLTSPCLGEHPWADFSFTGFIAMVASMGTLMVDALATSYFSNKSHFSSTSDSNNRGGEADNEKGEQQGQGTHGHTHATNGHAHGSLETSYHQPQLLRHRVIAQVLELGIIVHSIIIGISLGASRSPNTIRPLVAALTFHQFFEGMGLGGCITQAKFKAAAITLMVLFFSLTTPVGIVIGIGISNVYDENSTTALIVEGVFNAASSGILIYMALVDLLAADFMSAKMQKNLGLQLKATVSLLVGAGCMSLLAKWA